MLHVLIHMDRHVKRATSETLAGMLRTNPVVVRRMMAGLRDAGIVASEKGHGGGWELTRPLAAISLWDVYRAMGAPNLFTLGPDAEPADCLVERAVDARLAHTLSEAEALVLSRFRQITLADIADDFDTHIAALPDEVAARWRGHGHGPG